MPHLNGSHIVCVLRDPGHSGPCLPADLTADPSGRTPNYRWRGPRSGLSCVLPPDHPGPCVPERKKNSMASPYAPQPGDIGIVRMPGTVGRLIRFGQWLNGDGFEDYEHAFVVVRAQTEEDWNTGPEIIEAMPGGALLSPLSRYDGLEPVYLRCPEDKRQAVAAAALELRGTPYSVADYAALALHRAHIPTPLLKRYIRSSGHLICSQLADRAADISGWHLFTDGRWEGDVTPADLFRLYTVQRFLEGRTS